MLDATRLGQTATAASTVSISLEDFILETTRIPKAELKMKHLQSLFRRLVLPQALIDEHAHFSADTYCRSLLCRTPRFDMLVLGWRQGQLSTIHDHIDSLNCTRVLRGTLLQRIFRTTETCADGRVSVELLAEERIEAGHQTHLAAGGIHQMGNLDARDLVTLHIYAEPLSEITVFDPVARRSERKRLRYSLEDEFA